MLISRAPSKKLSSRRIFLTSVIILLQPSFFAVHAVAQQDCNQACSLSGGPALCGTFCTFQQNGIRSSSFCGSTQFPLCTPPAPTKRSSLTSFTSGGTNIVFFEDANGHVQKWSDSTGWHDQDLTAETGGAAASSGSSLTSFTSGGTNIVFFEDANGHVHQKWSDSTGWHDQDLTAETGGAAAESRVPGVGKHLSAEGAQVRLA